ncbi:protein RETICULATA-RELATED 1, chloroplastic-like isoform X3 [Hordeum vulgare subsp. vulgare]|uniref:protein RETICULATA-RELATED 1, chloroplastic-like isoform X3 n=1 Tax=Hordeum vulgare subsp. vulgare TaxID=112509 RepID=UPI0002948869|nr:protein RETICULATA-RELATED 1, chloroplastic-like isoform X3 [Hordeum vulgare subsp. vulgare]
MASLAAFHPNLPHAHGHPSHPSPTSGLLRLLPSRCRHRAPRRRGLGLAVSACASSAASPSAAGRGDRSEAASSLERCLAASAPGAAAPAAAPPRVPPAMKGGKQYGAFGAVTLEKAKLDLSQRKKKIMPELATGGGGGDIGKRIGHGGGDGGDDDGDDDDYFDDFDDGEEEDGGLFRRRIVIQELFNKEFIDAVMQEWCKTMISLPAGLRQAYEMGLVSSAQMVRFLSVFSRPTHTRSFSRALPGWLSRGLVGRTLADPSFPHKMAFEFLATFASSVWWEMNIRKERFEKEWDLAVVNALTASCCNLVVLGLLAPCRSYGSTSRFDFQNAIEKLPNNIFEKSYPLREFDLQKRMSAFLYKAAELSLVGVVAGSIQGGLSKALSARKGSRLSVTLPNVSTNALGYGAFLGLYANLRYQLLCGLDQYTIKRFDVLGMAIFIGTTLRSASNSRPLSMFA